MIRFSKMHFVVKNSFRVRKWVFGEVFIAIMWRLKKSQNMSVFLGNVVVMQLEGLFM